MTSLSTAPAPISGTQHLISRRATATVVGVLFVVQMVTAMFGTSMIEAFVEGDTDRASLTLGVLLMMGAGLAVVLIGLLMYPVLKEVNPRLAVWYPVLRITECLVSAACGVYLLVESQVVPNHLLWVYVPTGVGGIILTYLLFVSRLVPRPIALLGLVGYGLLTVGVPLDLLGLLDMSEGAGLLLVVPGGLFELVFFPIWLITKGFSAPRSVARAPRPPAAADFYTCPVADLDAVEARIWALLDPYRDELEEATIYGIPSLRWPGSGGHDYFAAVKRSAHKVSLYAIAVDTWPETLEGSSERFRSLRSGRATFSFPSLDAELAAELESFLRRLYQPYREHPRALLTFIRCG